MTELPPSATVVVIGAGLSGLTAAVDLHRRGIDVVVLESADRVGGRSLSVTTDLGSHLDLGGQWVGADHHRVMAMADEFGLTRFPMHTGRLPLVADGDRRIRPASPAVASALAALGALGVLSLREPHRRWESVSVADLVRRIPGARARRLLEVIGYVSWTTDLDRMSVATMVAMVRSQGGLRTMLATQGGAQDALIVEGAGRLAERLADELGGRVRTSTRATSINRSGPGVVVTTGAERIRGERVILAVPPPTAARIEHSPALPDSRRHVEEQTEMGTVYKAIAIYPTPTWRERTTGELIMLGSPGGAFFDTSIPDGPGHLCFLTGGPEARALDALAPAERQTVILEAVAAHLGDEVRHPVEWHEKSWHLDQHAGGGYVALPVIGADFTGTRLPAEPIGRLHIAGSESAADHPGYLDGAIEAGRRAAAEVAAALAEDALRPSMP